MALVRTYKYRSLGRSIHSIDNSIVEVYGIFAFDVHLFDKPTSVAVDFGDHKAVV